MLLRRAGDLLKYQNRITAKTERACPSNQPRHFSTTETGLNHRPLLILLALVSLASAAPLRAQEPLRWAADAEGGAPYIFKDPRNLNRDIGFEVDLARALEKELGRPIRFEQY